MGVWALGTKKDVLDFIDEIERIKDEYHGLVGVDAVYNGLDEAIREAGNILDLARPEPEMCTETRSKKHVFVEVDKDGTAECVLCKLRKSE